MIFSPLFRGVSRKHPALIPYRWDWSYLETPLAYQNEPFSEASRIFIEGQIKEAEKAIAQEHLLQHLMH